MRFNITIATTFIVLLLGHGAWAEDKDTSLAVDIPVGIGQEVKGIRFPHYDKDQDGKLSLRFNAEAAERASETKFNFKGLRIEIFDTSADKPTMQIFLSKAVYDRETKLLTSDEKATIQGEQFDISGSRLEFDSETRSSRLSGPVFMTITDVGESPTP